MLQVFKEGLSQKKALFVVDTTLCPKDTYSMSFDPERQERGSRARVIYRISEEDVGEK